MKIRVLDPIPTGEFELISVAEPIPIPEPEPPPVDPSMPWIAYRNSPEGDPLPLDGATVSGDIYVTCETPDPSMVSSVEFSGAHSRTESSHPYALTGDEGGVLRPWDTEALADGEHLLSVHILGAGSFTGSAVFTVDNVIDLEDPDAPDDPAEEPPGVPPPTPPAEAVSEVWKDEIGFIFAAPTVVGHYVNGDYWCLPTVVQSVYPGWDGSRGGAMVNPLHISDANGRKQGYDSTYSSYSDAARTRFPLVLSAGQSLVVTSSWRPGESGAPKTVSTQGYTVPVIRHAAVLTCVPEPPGELEFRPPYAGERKEVFDVLRFIDLDALPKWVLPAGAPSIASVYSKTSRLWLDHKSQWTGRALHPSHNMPGLDYGRDLTATIGDAALLLCANIPLADKRALAIHLCQIGIDQWAVLETGAQWADSGGTHGPGRRLPVILAGHLLDEPFLLNYFQGKSDRLSQETIQCARDDQGIYWREHWSRTREKPGSTGYRLSSSSAWMPQIMAVRALGLEESWAWPDSFEYQDAYMAESHSKDHHYAVPGYGWQREWWESTDGGTHAP